MPLTEEIKLAGTSFGNHLRSDPGVSELVRLREKVSRDGEATDLENELKNLYQNLIERQQNGEVLEHSDLDKYNAMKKQVQGHPYIAARDNQLEIVRPLFAETAQRMTAILGIEYTTFAQ